MNKFGHFAKVTLMGALALLLGTSLSAAQETGPAAHQYWQPTAPRQGTAAQQYWQPTAPEQRAAAQQYWQSTAPKQRAVAHNPRTTTHLAKPSAKAHMRNQPASARMVPAAAKDKEHRLILQVNSNDGAAMNLALNNAANVTQYYRDLGEKVHIEVITFGPGLHMLRDDTSPVKARIEVMALSTPEISFKACGNTKASMHKAENKDIPIIPQAQVVKSGVVRVMELEEQGWTYVKP
jgi:intracellular sulfur oxidation DsrE/DsrF family protein